MSINNDRRLQIKRNLSTDEISVIARALIRNDAITFFKSNYTSIYNTWTLIDNIALTCNSQGAERFVIAGFELINLLIMDKQRSPLQLRFAYIRLVAAIDVFKNAASNPQHLDCTPRKVGYGNTSVIIDTYLKAKGLPLNIRKLRRRLTEHLRIGRRWYKLTGSSPLFLSVYLNIAEKIMYV
jgi:hypothetical protein